MSAASTGAASTGRIDVMRPWLGTEESDALAEVIASGWIAQGPRVARFEAAFAEAMGVGHAVALSSCTTALHLGLVVGGVSAGDDVVVPSFSFIATANAVVHAGGRPVFADVDPVTGNVTAETIAAALTPATRAVIAVDQGGVPVDLEPIRALCDPLGILVLEDAACGAGSRYRGRSVGAGAALTAWSFHPRKLLTTGEGGMLTTDDADLAARARRLREHSMSVSAADRHGSVLAAPEHYDEVGFNFRMTDLQAALGLVQLGRLPALIERRRALAARYAAAFDDVPGLRTVTDPEHGTGNFQSFWIEVGDDYPLERDGLMAELASRDVSARRGIMAAHRQPPYRDHPNADRLPVTERLTDRTLILPLFHALTEQDQDRVIEAVLAPSRLAREHETAVLRA